MVKASYTGLAIMIFKTVSKRCILLVMMCITSFPAKLANNIEHVYVYFSIVNNMCCYSIEKCVIFISYQIRYV